MSKAEVALVHCPTYREVDAAVGELLAHLGGLESHIQPGQSVLLKPNLLAACPPDDLVTTHPALVRAVARRVKDIGAHPFIADSPAFGSISRVMRVTGMAEVAEELDIPALELDQPTSVRVAEAMSAHRFRLSGRALQADAIISLPKLKVHQQMQMTGAIKNLFGCVVGKRKAWLHLSHGKDRITFARMLLERVQCLEPALTITDGVVAMQRMGPRNGDPYPLGLLTGGTNVVALDAVHWALIVLQGEVLDFLIAARELGMGPTELCHIEVRGLPLEQAAVSDFELSRQIPVSFSPIRIARSTLRNLWLEKVAAT